MSDGGRRRLSRRRALSILGTGTAGAVASGCMGQISDAPPHFSSTPELTDSREPARDQLIVAPEAVVLSTACDYCIVGCGYRVTLWPTDGDACSGARSNQVGVSLSQTAHNVVMRDGRAHHVVVDPDPEATVVNPGGDYGGGGSLASKLFNPDAPNDRLQKPRLRVGDEHVEIEWLDALHLAAEVIRHSRDVHGKHAFGMKSFSYNYYENTYALTKLMFAEGALHSPCWAPHDQPASASSAPGLSDAGVDAFSAAYSDWAEADVLMVSGVSLVEARPVLFQNWVRGGAKMIVVNPRRDATAACAVEDGGLHLQLVPGTDTVLYNAIARVIVERGWQDSDFIEDWLGGVSEIEAESSWRRQRFATDFDGFREFLLADELYSLRQAAATTGVAEDDIVRAAEMLTGGGGVRPRASFMLEKGNYWGFNYENSASYTSLGLLCGAGNRPGQMISRGGGHQRGMLRAASYPRELIPDGVPTFEGEKLPFNIDAWAAEGNFRAFWVVGTTWFAASAGSAWLRDKVRDATVGRPEQLPSGSVAAGGGVDRDAVMAIFRARMDTGGTVLMQSDVYENAVTELADLVFPASGWGEHDFTRMQGERRLRLYSRIADAPGEAKPDWWIAAEVAKRLGFEGFDWEDTNEIFEEAAEVSRGRGAHDYGDLVVQARAEGMRGHDYLGRLGTTGIQCPVRTADDGSLEGTTRLHEDGFSTASGRAYFVIGDFRAVEDRWRWRAPRGGELWLTNMRTNAWQSLYDDARTEFRKDLVPDAIVQVHPADAAQRGIVNGDEVRLHRDDVAVSNGDTVSAEVFGVAHVTEDVQPGLMCGYFNFRGSILHAVNALTDADLDPINNLYTFKTSRAQLSPTGRQSPAASRMSFVPRAIFGAMGLS
ncbi:MAG: molybdopterin-dependent oxidoreductase [Deltaproteobacteria bacterium]|nr:molybdopterin-dependent oxidoreductase [Deltaproteobacteria bacterium]